MKDPTSMWNSAITQSCITQLIFRKGLIYLWFGVRKVREWLSGVSMIFHIHIDVYTVGLAKLLLINVEGSNTFCTKISLPHRSLLCAAMWEGQTFKGYYKAGFCLYEFHDV